MFTPEQFLSIKCLRSMSKLRIQRGEYYEALKFIKDCTVYDNIVEVYKVFQIIKEDK